MSLPDRAAGLTPDGSVAFASTPCTPDRTHRPLRGRCTEVFQPGETSNAHAAVHHTALPHRPTRSRFESLPLQSRRPEEQSLNSCKRQTVADHGNHQSGDKSGDKTRNWPDSYSEIGLKKQRYTAYAPQRPSHHPSLDHNVLHDFKRATPLFVPWTSEADYSSINKPNICSYTWLTKKW